MSPFRGRRRCLAFIPAAMSAAMLGGWTSSVSASPGFLGKYDFAHPMFLQGTVVGIEPTLPRAPDADDPVAAESLGAAGADAGLAAVAGGSG